MDYQEQNIGIQKQIAELDHLIDELEEKVNLAKQLVSYYGWERLRLLEDRLETLKGRREYLQEKLKESPQKRKLTNLREKAGDLIEKIPPLPDLEHVSGRLYMDKNGGCSTWALILVVVFFIIFAIHLTVTDGWTEFLAIFRK